VAKGEPAPIRGRPGPPSERPHAAFLRWLHRAMPGPRTASVPWAAAGDAAPEKDEVALPPVPEIPEVQALPQPAPTLHGLPEPAATEDAATPTLQQTSSAPPPEEPCGVANSAATIKAQAEATESTATLAPRGSVVSLRRVILPAAPLPASPRYVVSAAPATVTTVRRHSMGAPLEASVTTVRRHSVGAPLEVTTPPLGAPLIEAFGELLPPQEFKFFVDPRLGQSLAAQQQARMASPRQFVAKGYCTAAVAQERQALEGLETQAPGGLVAQIQELVRAQEDFLREVSEVKAQVNSNYSQLKAYQFEAQTRAVRLASQPHYAQYGAGPQGPPPAPAPSHMHPAQPGHPYGQGIASQEEEQASVGYSL